MRILIIIVIALAALVWYRGTHNTVVTRSGGVDGDINVFADPVQNNLSGLRKVKFGQGHLELLAEFDVAARVLDKNNYHVGKEASVAPLDLTLGWKKMAVPAVYGPLNVRNSNRWYHYSWKGAPPIPEREIIASSANMHIIPADKSVRAVMDAVKKGQIVRLRGYLVEYKEGDDRSWWRWRSSLSRTDTGDGSCEQFYVEHAEYR